jgi:hypothetical protein
VNYRRWPDLAHAQLFAGASRRPKILEIAQSGRLPVHIFYKFNISLLPQ